MALQDYAPLVEVTRGKTVESIHYGAVAVVDANNRLIASCGNPDAVTFLRSSAKPFQALPFMEQNGAEMYGFTTEEVALMCSSHSGTDRHVQVVSSMQAKVGVGEQDLLCGTHFPMYEPLAAEMVRRGEKPTPNRHNCSGKHTGMLAQARLRGLPVTDYIDFDHPVQVLNLKVFSEMCSIPVSEIALGVDGCSAPVFAVPLRQAAFGYARLVDPKDLSRNRAAACKQIVGAMTTNPFMVSGPDRFDFALMEAGQGRILTKGGAEGYQAIGLLPDVLSPGSPGVGITIKISDGDLTGRAAASVATAVLSQLGVLNANQLKTLARYNTRPVHNWRGFEVGEIRAGFRLDWHV
jgi:L-asparaginase II